MQTLTQKEAVVQVVMATLGDDFDSSTSVMDQLTKEQIAEVKSTLVSQIQEGKVSFNKEVDDEATLTRYVSGMVSNHFRKAKELNGGSAYKPKTTGRGSRDPQLSALSQLLKRFDEGSDQFSKVNVAITARRTELSDERSLLAKERRKAKQSQSIDVGVLPPELQGLANSVIS